MRHLPDDITTAASAAVPVSDPAAYRKALGCFGTGVTVVTAHHEGQDWGMTCNSFTSVSLDPPLVLWSIRKAATSLQAFTHSDGFTVSVLAQHQAALAWQFAQGDMPQRFAGVPTLRLPSGRLMLQACVAWFDCRIHQIIDAGDHHMVLGAVQSFENTDQPALAYYKSQLAQFQALP
jgi:3-hydroxy-9,10-secoandrosta-1,3,5(10)-triene-9,17-dione monooxygenase reductase component